MTVLQKVQRGNSWHSMVRVWRHVLTISFVLDFCFDRQHVNFFVNSLFACLSSQSSVSCMYSIRDANRKSNEDSIVFSCEEAWLILVGE